jgi:hypothetical protein
MANFYVLDKGYDSEKIHRQIRDEIHAISFIPIRNWNASYVSGVFRQEMAKAFDIYRDTQLYIKPRDFLGFRLKIGIFWSCVNFLYKNFEIFIHIYNKNETDGG